jgi:hypothetical protein
MKSSAADCAESRSESGLAQSVRSFDSFQQRSCIPKEVGNLVFFLAIRLGEKYQIVNAVVET